MITIWEILDRAEKGPYCSEHDFSLKILAPKLAELVKSYDVRFNPGELVPLDASLADDVWKASIDLVREVGVLCSSTSRRITFTDDEIKDELADSHSDIVYGEGAETFHLTPRTVGDSKRPKTWCGMLGTPISEEIYVKLAMSCAKEPTVDLFEPGTVHTIEDRTIKAGSPLEIHASKMEVAWTREAARRVGRPGLPIVGTESSVTALGEIAVSSTEGGLKKTDGHMVAMISELKTTYDALAKAVHLIEYGANINTIYASIYGGIAGGAEGCAIVNTALSIAATLVHKAVFQSARPMHVKFVCSTFPEGIWAMNINGMAISRNSHLLSSCATFTAAGPCTDMILYETAAQNIGATVSGYAAVTGIGPASSSHLDHGTGLEGRFMGEVAKASTTLKLESANELVKEIVKKYQKSLQEPPLGKRFQDCYDTKTIRPTDEWLGIHERVKKELADMGLQL